MDVSLDGKVALITGAGPNIGSGIALMLSKYGARVACNDVRLAAAQATAERVQRNGGQAMAVAVDVTREDDLKLHRRSGRDVRAYGYPCQQRQDGGLRAKSWAYTPPPNEEASGPLPLIPMDVAQAAGSRA